VGFQNALLRLEPPSRGGSRRLASHNCRVMQSSVRLNILRQDTGAVIAPRRLQRIPTIPPESVKVEIGNLIALNLLASFSGIA